MWPRAFALAAAATLIILLDLAYRTFVVGPWTSYGLVYEPRSQLVLAGAAILAVLPAAWLPTSARIPSDVVRWLIYALAYVPTALIPQIVLGQRMDVIPLNLALLASFGAASIGRPLPHIRLPVIHLGRIPFGGALGALVAATTVYLLATFGLPSGVPDLGTIYETRAEFIERLGGSRTLAGYVVPWAGYVVYPLAIAYGSIRRILLLAVAGVAGELLVYAITGFKATLLVIALVVGVVILLRFARAWFGAAFMAAAASVVALASLASGITESLTPVAVLVVRLFHVPGQLAGYFYEYFSSHPHYLLSHSVFRSLFDQPYPLEPPEQIGLVYFGVATVSANANFWADGYANFGQAGLLGAGLLLRIVLGAMDSVAEGKDLRLAAPLFAISATVLSNAALLTSILTLGIGLAGLLVYLSPSIGPERDRTSSEAPSGA